jgi:hypothetical protein
MRDTIVFEPTVEIATKSKPVQHVQESVKIGKITVSKPVINEELLRKTHAASIIAKSLNYVPEGTETPQQTVNRAIEQSPAMSEAQLDTLKNMLKLAESVGIDTKDQILPALLEVKAVQSVAQKTEEDDEESDAELEAMIAHIKDWDDIVDAYEPDELALVDDETGEEIDSDLKDDLKEETELNEVLSRAERLKAKVRFARTAAKRQRKAKIALKKHSNNATINKRARHLAVKTIETKLARGKPLSSLSVPERERIERLVQKRSKLIGRLALKLTHRVRTIERDRLTHSTYTK